VAADLLNGDEQLACANACFTFVDRHAENVGNSMEWHGSRKRAQIKKLRDGVIKSLTQYIKKIMKSVRTRVEHLFHIVKIYLAIGTAGTAESQRTKANVNLSSR
jgi:transposase, IS5 family